MGMGMGMGFKRAVVAEGVLELSRLGDIDEEPITSAPNC
jgi:hypothetical protein